MNYHLIMFLFILLIIILFIFYLGHKNMTKDYFVKTVEQYENNRQYLDEKDTPKVLWIFWFTKSMSKPRQKAYAKLTTDLKKILITDENLQSYLKWPVHPAVNFLSDVHRADYYRIYFLLHYGGAYSDVKGHAANWEKYWNLYENPNLWMLSAPEVGPDGVASPPDKDYSSEYQKLMSNCFFTARANNPFIKSVHDTQNDILTKKYTELSKNPAKHPRDCYSDESKYPIRWAELLGEIMSEKSLENYNYRHFLLVLPSPTYNDYI